MKIGEHIREIRISKGLTQSELSEKSGVALRTIQRIEKNEVSPSSYSLKAIGEALGVQLNEASIKANDAKFEFRIIVSNVSNLLEDTKVLLKRNWRLLLVLSGSIFVSLYLSDLKSLLYGFWDDSQVSIATINCGSESECDIELVKKDADGKTIWRLIIGGTSYDKAGQVVQTGDGSYLVVGSTSSYGKGNYDVLLAKVSPSGEMLWQKTYGEFLNDYGLKIASVADNLYAIEATKQICKTVNVSNDCTEREWVFTVDEGGNIKQPL